MLVSLIRLVRENPKSGQRGKIDKSAINLFLSSMYRLETQALKCIKSYIWCIWDAGNGTSVFSDYLDHKNLGCNLKNAAVTILSMQLQDEGDIDQHSRVSNINTKKFSFNLLKQLQIGNELFPSYRYISVVQKQMKRILGIRELCLVNLEEARSLNLNLVFWSHAGTIRYQGGWKNLLRPRGLKNSYSWNKNFTKSKNHGENHFEQCT